MFKQLSAKRKAEKEKEIALFTIIIAFVGMVIEF